MIIPIIIAAGAIGLVYSLTGITHANAGQKQLPRPELPVPALPGRTSEKKECSQAERNYMTVIIAKYRQGNATLKELQSAYDIARTCAPMTAKILKDAIMQSVAADQSKQNAANAATPEKQLAIIITAPDAPPSPVPRDPKSGKVLWKSRTVKGNVIIIPQFRPVLNLFRALQSIIGATQDGRIGDESIVKFRNLMTKRGFKKFPKTSPALAANAAKYIAVLSQNINPNQVGGAHGGSTDPSSFLG